MSNDCKKADEFVNPSYEVIESVFAEQICSVTIVLVQIPLTL